MTQTISVESQAIPETVSDRSAHPNAFHEFSDLVKQTLFPTLVNLHSVGLAMDIDPDNIRCLVADRVIRFYEGDEDSPLVVTDMASVFEAIDRHYPDEEQQEQEEEEDASTTTIFADAGSTDEEPEPF